MAKRPKDVPDIGDRVEMRGSGLRGTLINTDTDNDWSSVKWDTSGPTVVHLFELRKIPKDGK